MRKSRRQRAHPQGTRSRNRMIRNPAGALAREAAPDLSRRARVRLEMLDWHRTHGANVSRTARHFGYSRPTVYRWLARFDRFHLETLEDASSAPRRRRRPSWTVGQVGAVRSVRDRYPRWGKAKLAILLRRVGLSSGRCCSCRPRWTRELSNEWLPDVSSAERRPSSSSR